MKLEELRNRLRPKKKEPKPTTGRHPSGVEYTTIPTTLDGNQNSLTNWGDLSSAEWKAEHEAELKRGYAGQFFVGYDPGIGDAESVVITYDGKRIVNRTKISREKP